MNSPIRLGIVGAGMVARDHADALRTVPTARIAAVADPDPERARAFADAYGGAVFPDADALIASAPLDALIVCVPPHAHGDIEIQAAARGLHLFVEKPIHRHLAQARRIADALRDSGVLTQVGYNGRYSPGSQRLRTFLQDKAVGTAAVTRWFGISPKPWWRRYDLSGGHLFSVTTHQIDLLRFVLGEVESVCAFSSVDRLFPDQADVTVPDSQIALLTFASGTVATVNSSCAVRRDGGLGTVDLALREARVRWEWGGGALSLDPPERYSLPPQPETTRSADAAFVEAVATGDRSLLLSPYDDGLKTLAVTLAINASAEQGGRPIAIDSFLEVA